MDKMIPALDELIKRCFQMDNNQTNVINIMHNETETV